MEIVVIPTLVWGTGEEPVTAVVGEKHAVALECLQDDLIGRREGAGVEIRLQAETLAQEKGIEVEGKAGETVNIAQISSGDWIGYSQVDFKNGASKLVLRVSGSGGSIDVSVDGCLKGQPGTSIGKCEMTNAAGGSAYSPVTCTISGPAGPHDLCLTFSGSPNFRIDSWHLE